MLKTQKPHRLKRWWCDLSLEKKYLSAVFAILGIGFIALETYWWTSVSDTAFAHLVVLGIALVFFMLMSLVSGGDIPATIHRAIRKRFRDS